MTVPDAYLYDTGAQQWRSFAAWPPKGGASRSLYLRAGGTVSFDPPAAGERPYDQYVSDPAHPVPTARDRSSRPTTAAARSGGMWEAEDQRFVDGRPDVVSWVSEPLDEDLTIAGDMTAQLVASTTGRDADWVVKLIDVYPDSMPDELSWAATS